MKLRTKLRNFHHATATIRADFGSLEGGLKWGDLLGMVETRGGNEQSEHKKYTVTKNHKKQTLK